MTVQAPFDTPIGEVCGEGVRIPITPGCVVDVPDTVGWSLVRVHRFDVVAGWNILEDGARTPITVGHVASLVARFA